MAFTYTLKKQEQIPVFTLTGDLIEKSQADQLMQEVDDAILNNNTGLVLDLSKLAHLNSSGLTILIQILTKARKAGGEAVVVNVGKRIKELLIITKLNTVFTVMDTVKHAVNKLNAIASK